MSKQLPERANLEHLKNEAKALKKAQAIKLSEAQLAIAREYGFASWAKLKRHVEGFESLRDEFFDAIRAGDKERVIKALKESPNLAHSHNPHSFGEVPITTAANRADLGMIDLLLKAGADINARSNWWAGSFGALDMADEKTSEYLLKKGATLTPHAAARLGKVQELKQMITNDPSVVHQRGGDGQLPLHFASTAEIVDVLVDAGADLEARDLDHESTAAQWRIKNMEVLKRLIERGAKSDIFMAVALDDEALIRKHLMEDPRCLTRKATEAGNAMIYSKAPGAPIYTYEVGPLSPLQVAASLGHDSAYQLLFHESSPAQKLLAAVWKGDRDTALSLKCEVANLNAEESAQICNAARHRRLDLVLFMLELGFNVNAQDHEGMSAVMWSGFHGWKEGMEAILPFQPDLELRNVYGGTALGTLCYGSINGWYKDAPYAECAELLIRAGSDIKPEMTGNDDVAAILNRYR